MNFLHFFFIFASTFLCSTTIIENFSEYPSHNRVAQSPSTKSNSLKDVYLSYHLKNKLRVVVHEHDDDKKKFEAALSVGVGSSGVSKKQTVWNEPIFQGLPHLFEHCLFYSNMNFPNPFEIYKFMRVRGGLIRGSTYNNHTTYSLQIPRGDFISEALLRFASMFISPIFTQEFVETEISIVNNEWADKRDNISPIYDRCCQLFMTKGEPSELFKWGNSKSFSGDIDVLLEQIKLFWKTHYTADNMNLAISVYRSDRPIVERAIYEYFELIKSLDSEMVAPPLKSAPTPFWSEDHKDHYLKIYTPNERRNHLHLFWHISCNEGAVCTDSLEMIAESIKTALDIEYPERKRAVYYRDLTYEDYVFVIRISVRNQEHSNLTSLKDQIIETVRNKAPSIKSFNTSPIGYDLPENLVRRVSQVMLFTDSLANVPTRAHFPALVNQSSKALNEEHWKLLQKDPRVAVSYKSDYFKNALLEETLLVDPYFPIHYKFVDSLEEEALDSKVLSLKPSEFRIKLKISHSFISYPFKFLRGVFIETIRIILKDKKLKFESFLENDFFKFVIHFERPQMWDVTMKEVMQALANPTDSVLEKARNQWLKELKSDLNLSYIAEEYAKVLINPNITNEYSLLISDPNPEDLSLDRFKTLRNIFQKIGKLQVTPYEFPNIFYVMDEVEWLWRSGVSQPKYYSKFKQPSIWETFIYAPPPLPTTNSGVMIIFKWEESFIKYIRLTEKILYLFFFKRLRMDMKLTYTPIVNILSETHFYIMVSSPNTPDIVQNSITSVIKEIPDYIRGFSDSDWKLHVNNFIDDIDDKKRLLLNEDCREYLISIIQLCLFEESGRSRLIIQLWGRGHDEARAAYLRENKNLDPFSTFISSIKDYPRE